MDLVADGFAVRNSGRPDLWPVLGSVGASPPARTGSLDSLAGPVPDLPGRVPIAPGAGAIRDLADPGPASADESAKVPAAVPGPETAARAVPVPAPETAVSTVPAPETAP